MSSTHFYGQHVCHIYRREDEKRDLQLEFFKEGLNRGEKVICIASSRPANKSLAEKLGWDSLGHVRFHSSREVFIDAGGGPDPGGAVSWMLRAIKQGLKEGAPGVRISVEMGWAAGDDAAQKALLEYEENLERRLKGKSALCMCHYPLNGFSPSVLLGVVGIHPVMYLRGRLIDNRERSFVARGSDPLAKALGKFIAHAWSRPVAMGTALGDPEEVSRGVLPETSPAPGDVNVRSGLPFRDPTKSSLAAMAEALADAVVGWDEEGRICVWNRAAEGLAGWRADEVLGKSIGEVLLTPEGYPAGLFKGGKVHPLGLILEGALLLRDGERLDVEFTLGSWGSDKAGTVLAVLRQVREKKLMERALRESEERYRELFENMGEGVAVVDEEENIIFANPAGHRIFGVEKGDLVGRNLREFTDEENFALLQEQTMIRKAGRRSVYELQITDARGRRKTLRITATPRFDREGNYRGAFGVFTDITEKKFREEELENFSSTVAHDLSGSLAVVEGFSLAAERASEEGDRETERESLQNLREAVSRMQRFVESLLEYAKAGRPGGNAERIRLEDMVREVEDELLPVLRERNIKLRIVPTDRDAWVDPVRLRQVLLNLVNNAASHMGDVPEPEVVVGSRVRKNTMVVYVRDNGVGIPADLQEGIFEPFRKGGSGGSGLGLAIVKRAVESWGGRVWLDSAPGRGTTFFFTVPLAPAATSS